MTHSLPHHKNEHQLSINNFCSCILLFPTGCAVTLTYNRTIGRLCRQTCFCEHRTYARKMSVNRASTILGIPSLLSKGRCGDIDPQSSYRLSFEAKLRSATSYLCPENERQRSVNHVRPSIFINQRAMQRHWLVIDLWAVFVGKNAFGDIVLMT